MNRGLPTAPIRILIVDDDMGAADSREQAQSRRLRLIALTSSPEHTAREQARVAGFERYLVKPIAAGDLSDLVGMPPQ